jgi:prophage DNA circulation protein
MSDSGIAVLDELLEPVSRAFSQEVAQAVVNIRASDVAQARIAELAEKCNEGLLTPAEQAEYESYVQAADLISVLQAKARVWLASRKAS